MLQRKRDDTLISALTSGQDFWVGAARVQLPARNMLKVESDRQYTGYLGGLPWGHCVVLLGKALYSVNRVSLHQVYK